MHTHLVNDHYFMENYGSSIDYIMNMDMDEFFEFTDILNEKNIEKIARNYYNKKLGSFDEYLENFKKLYEEFNSPDNEIKDFDKFLNMCRGYGWPV